MQKLPNIIIEGIGGSGKTTISNFIQKLYKTYNQPFITHHFQYPKGDSNIEKYGYQHGQFDLMFKMIKHFNDNNIAVILDRSWIGENIWSPIYRNMSPVYLEPLQDDYKYLNNIILNVYADASIIYQRLIKRNPNIYIDDPYFNKYSTPEIAINDLINKFKNIIESREDYNIKSFNFDASSEFSIKSETCIIDLINKGIINE